jgi:hypothetical protein
VQLPIQLLGDISEQQIEIGICAALDLVTELFFSWMRPLNYPAQPNWFLGKANLPGWELT